jgi:hypothetical protein
MGDTLLIDNKTPAPRSRQPRQYIVGVLLLIALIAGVGWYVFSQRSSGPTWDRQDGLDLLAPAGDAFQSETPWVRMNLSPARPGDSNALHFLVATPGGTPVPSQAESARIASVTAQPVGGSAAPETLTLSSGTGGTLDSTAQFQGGGWWKLSVVVDGATDPADFFLLFPDPNVNGPAAVPAFASSPGGEALFQRGLEGITSLRTVRYTEWIADGRGNAGFSEHEVSAGGEGQPPGFIYRAAGGMEAIVLGTTRWVKLPGDLGWDKQEGSSPLPPSEWGEEYRPATQFAILGEETVDGERCQILALLAPELTEPQRRSAAWYLWWVGTESGRVRQESMVSRFHYMHRNYRDFDAPLVIGPPETAATGVAATPVS